MNIEEEKERIERNIVEVNAYLADHFDVVGSAERPPLEVVFKVKDHSTAQYLRLIVPMATLRDNESSFLNQKLRAQDVAGQLVSKRNFTWGDDDRKAQAAA